MRDEPEFRIDRSAVRIVPLSESDNDLEYWLSKTPQERLKALEVIRQVLYGYRDGSLRLQRVFEVARRERD